MKKPLKIPLPKIGDVVYVPTLLLNGKEKFIGGQATVKEIIGIQVVTQEHIGVNYRWNNGLDRMQRSLREVFNSQRAQSIDINIDTASCKFIS